MVSGPTVPKHAVEEQDNQRAEQLKNHFLGDRIARVNQQDSRTATKIHVLVRFTIQMCSNTKMVFPNNIITSPKLSINLNYFQSTVFGLLGALGQNAQKHVMVGRKLLIERLAYPSCMMEPHVKEITIEPKIVILIPVQKSQILANIQVNFLKDYPI